MDDNKPKRHHYVPICYLKNFTNDGKLQILNIERVLNGFNEYIKTKTPSQICYIDNYYTINDKLKAKEFGLDGFDEMYLESTLFKKFENQYPRLFQNILQSSTLLLNDVIKWCDFIMHLKVRNSFFRSDVIQNNKSEWIDNSMRNILPTLIEKDEFPYIPDFIKKFLVESIIEKHKNDNGFSAKMQFSALAKRNGENSEINERFRHAIGNSIWNIYKTEIEPFFITSDNPGFSTSLADHLTYNTRFVEDFKFYLPLSPNYCLVIDGSAKDDIVSKKAEKVLNRYIVSEAVVLKVNNGTIQQRNNLLIASYEGYLSRILKENKPMKI